jgi:hypothetical protein
MENPIDGMKSEIISAQLLSGWRLYDSPINCLWQQVIRSWYLGDMSAQLKIWYSKLSALVV